MSMGNLRVKYYLIRNTTSDFLTMSDLLDEAARGRWKIRGFGTVSNSEERERILRHIGVFAPHEDAVVSILSTDDSDKGIVCHKGLKTGVQGGFIIREVQSPRHIWTQAEEPDLTDGGTEEGESI